MNIPRLFNRFFLILTCFVILLTHTSVWGFHDGGVAKCQSCHIIHNSENGSSDPDSPNGNVYLLRFETASDLCLSCHAQQYGEVLGTDPLNPPPEKGAGNFVFLLEDNINDASNGASNPIPGSASGHNLNAPSKGLTSDPNYTTAPGGTFSSSMLGCTSCHDPHGNTNYRMLYGIGPVQNNTYTFTNPAPVADGIDIELTSESKSNHNAYKSGMSDWCGNCHGMNYHMNSSNNSPLRHTAMQSLGSDITNRYNLYNGTDSPLGGNASIAYLPEVPFEDAGNTINSTQGPSQNSKVMCLTCHRAHATSAPRAGRWDFNVGYLQEDGVASGSYPIPNPYQNSQQKQLCFKCHTEDVTNYNIMQQ